MFMNKNITHVSIAVDDVTIRRIFGKLNSLGPRVHYFTLKPCNKPQLAFMQCSPDDYRLSLSLRPKESTHFALESD